MARVLYTMSLQVSSRTGAASVLERRFTPRGAEVLGSIEETSYLGERPRSLWERLLGRPAQPRLRPPFDESGRDVHGLLQAHPPSFDGEDDALGTVRLAQGTISALLPRERGDEVVVRDAWSVEQGARLLSGLHFGLSRPEMPPVAVAFATCPLIVAKPQPMRLGTVLSKGLSEGEVDERAFTNLWPALDTKLMATGVELRVGDSVEVLGVVSRPEDCHGRFDLMGRQSSYREAPAELTLVIGDRPGLRMVIRRL